MGALSPNAMNVPGTGQNVGQLKQLGYDPSLIQSMNPQANTLQRFGRAGLQGLSQGLTSYGQQANNPYFYGYGQGR